MYTVVFYKGNKNILRKEFNTLQDAEDFVLLEDHENNYEYEIYNNKDNTLVKEGEIESNDDIFEGSMKLMFPDEESYDGFDIDDFFGNN